jgi:hypothetical protein
MEQNHYQFDVPLWEQKSHCYVHEKYVYCYPIINHNQVVNPYSEDSMPVEYAISDKKLPSINRKNIAMLLFPKSATAISELL